MSEETEIEQNNKINIKSLRNRINFLEKTVDELVYLAKCQGWKFDHIKEIIE